MTAKKAAGKKVLIVDDEKALSHALQLKLEKEGLEVDTASNGAEGLEKAKAGKYNVVVTDLIMPKVTGFDLLEGLKGSGTKVIVMSNLSQDEDRKRVEDLGAVKLMVKTVDALPEIVKEVMKLV